VCALHSCPVAGAHVTSFLLQRYHLHIRDKCCLQDPRNNMPVEPNQQPFPGQRKPISTERQVSSIPKGGTESSWVYPSPQMFYNGVHPHQSPGDILVVWGGRCSIHTVSLTHTMQCRFLRLLSFAALKRKGKGNDVTEDDMDAVVHAHNSGFSHLALHLP
jgi:cytochrome c heme-lyase